MVVRSTILILFFRGRRGRGRVRRVVKSITKTPYASFDYVLAEIARRVKKGRTPELIYAIA